MDLSNLLPDPIAQFDLWYKEAVNKSPLRFPNAVALATASKAGMPSVRMVLLKDFNDQGFSFYTNHESQKGLEMAENPQAALCFFWDAIHRQVRVSGQVQRLSKEESADYFHSRPRESQIGAWASAQSRTIAARTNLEENFKSLEQKFTGEIPCPPYWGGYLLRPATIEFWQEKPHRLHDRILYTRSSAGEWTKSRLSP